MTNIGTKSIDPSTPLSDTLVHQDEVVQLSKLSSVLNGLEGGASIIRRHILDAMRAVRSGNYFVDPAKLSRRIIGEALYR